jgi:transcription elongation GreA/GreB family factor
MRALRGRLEGATARGDAAEVQTLTERIAGAVVLEPEDRSVAALGAEVTLRDAAGKERVVRLVTPDEVGLVERGASPSSPIGSAVAGKRAGDDVELPGGVELAVVRIAWPAAT